MVDRLAPRWELELEDGSLLPPGRKNLIPAPMVRATIDGADELVLNATAWDGSNYLWFDEKILAPGNRVIFWAGYGDDLVALQRFRLVRMRGIFQSGSPPAMTLRGYSAEVNLVEYHDARSYSGVSDSAIVRDIADEHGLTWTTATVQETPVREGSRVKKKGDSDLDFLRKLAVANGFGQPYVRYDHARTSDVLYWRQTSLEHQAEIATFRHATSSGTGTLFAMTPETSLAGVPTKVEVIGWDPEAQEPIRVVAEITAAGQQTTIIRGTDVGELTPEIKSGAQLRVAVLSSSDDAKQERREVLVSRTMETTESALKFAEQWLNTRQRAYMVGRAEVVGWETLWPGQIHRFEGLPELFNGLWEWMTVDHQFGAGGYTCKGDVVRVLEQAAAPTEGT